jgi:RHS repeat-associated protein
LFLEKSISKSRKPVEKWSNYTAFGYEMPGRSMGSDFKYSFNGKIDDKNSGWQSQDYGYRMYDYRLARFMSTDPMASSFSYMSPYIFAENRPIDGIDLDGLQWIRADVVINSKYNVTASMCYKTQERKVSDGVEYINLGMHMYVNSNTGKTKYTQVPLEGKDIGDWEEKTEWVYSGAFSKDLFQNKGWHAHDECKDINGNSECEKIQCFGACVKTCKEFGFVVKDPNSYHDISHDGKGKNAISYAQAIDFINKEIEAGRPVVVGIDNGDYNINNKNTNGIIDHWIVLMGKGQVGGYNSFLVYENVAGNHKEGTQMSLLKNHLQINPKEFLVKTIFSKGKNPFKVIGIRGTYKPKSKLRSKL